MKNHHDQLKPFIITILSMSSICLIILIFNLKMIFPPYIYTMIFATAMTMMVDSFQRKKIFYITAYFVILILYNPFSNPLIHQYIWKAIHASVLLLIVKNIYDLAYSDNVKLTKNIAIQLNEYLHDLEKQISHLTFHETAMVIKREHPKEYGLSENRLSWRSKEIPDFEFYVLSDYYSRGHRNKGGVSAKGRNEFDNIEIHLNFNLTHHVKYAVLEEKGPLKTSLFGKQLKYTLIHKFQYVDMAKVLGS